MSNMELPLMPEGKPQVSMRKLSDIGVKAAVSVEDIAGRDLALVGLSVIHSRNFGSGYRMSMREFMPDGSLGETLTVPTFSGILARVCDQIFRPVRDAHMNDQLDDGGRDATVFGAVEKLGADGEVEEISFPPILVHITGSRSAGWSFKDS